jgi:hypothetical protein
MRTPRSVIAIGVCAKVFDGDPGRRVSTIVASAVVGVPLLDTRRHPSGTAFDRAELKSIPTARDPWVILQQTPGALVDQHLARPCRRLAKLLIRGRLKAISSPSGATTPCPPSRL